MCEVNQRIAVITCDLAGQRNGPEMSVINYHYKLRNGTAGMAVSV